ncbi:MAG: hypothetical protein GYA45_04445 [Pelolinea sp.]|nr:hypothetical protein [Pelolinea sp.]
MNNKRKQTNPILFLLAATLVIFIISFMEMKKIYWGGLDKNLYFTPWSILVLVFFIGIICLAFGLLISHFLFHRDCPDWLQKSSILKTLAFIFFGIFPSYFFQFSKWGLIFNSVFLRVLLLASIIFLTTYIRVGKKIFSFKIHHFFPSLIFTVSCILLCSRLRLIVDYPFSLSWSEGNRFWDYSLLFWKDHYTVAKGSTAAAFLDLGRQSFWGLAFLNQNLTIAGMRAWNAILYFIPPLTLGFLLFKKKKIKLPTLLLYALGTYAFLNEGPIYAPLILCTILVFLAGEVKIFPFALVLIVCAGYVANMTRFTWIIAPVVWSFLLIYFREKNSPPLQRNLKSYLAALSGLVGGIILPNFISPPTSSIILKENSSSDIFNSARTIFESQDLLWYRLFPSKTFPLGILPALFLIVAPLLILLIIYLKKEKVQLEKAERFYLTASLVGFFVVGAVVSVKIGGGSNLHNMDMFLLTLFIIIGIFWKNGLAEWFETEIKTTNWASILVLFLLVYQNVQYIKSAMPISLPSDAVVENALDSIQSSVDEFKKNGDVLFIDQRQLLTFGEIKNVDLVGEYEKKLLMNEALSNDQDYFNSFYQDLRSQRFALIINEPTRVVYQTDENNFGEENNAYVKWVSEPLLCYYEPLKTFPEVGVELLIPRTSPIPDELTCP